jgi:DNA polymerase-1
VNIQNIPRGSDPDLGFSIRRLFIPKNEIFVFFDFSQIELSIFAFYLEYLANDNSMSSLLNEGKDLHASTAAALFKAKPSDVTKEMRAKGKTFNFSMLYGGGVSTIQRQLECSRDEAYMYLERFHERYPGVRTLQDMCAEVVRRRGYIRTLWNRKLVPRKDYAALNTLIQGAAASVFKDFVAGFYYNYADKTSSEMVFLIHDEIGFDTFESEYPFLRDACRNLIRHGSEEIEMINGRVTLCGTLSIARKSWADKEEVENV